MNISVSMTENFLIDCIVYLLPNDVVTKRIKLFKEKVLKFGGTVVEQPRSASHVVVEDSLLTNPSKLINALKALNVSIHNFNCKIVGTLWLSRCFKEKKLLSTESFEFKSIDLMKRNVKKDELEIPNKKPRIEPLDIRIPSQSCIVSNDNFTSNQVIINELQKLVDIYRARRDKWRTLGYEKAIRSINSYKKEIISADDVKNLPNISSKMIEKISEILENGYLSKARELFKDEKVKTLDMFGKIWGVGPTIAELWYQQGWRTLEDIKEKVNLTEQQKIGLKYYYDIQEEIPREEVEEIFNIVKKAALSVNPSLYVMPCGSYRRGKQSCGDVDVLIMKQDYLKYTSILPKILSILKSNSFIVDDLVGSENNNVSKKYLGLCKLPRENSKIRRLDIFVVPECEFATAVMHYTGSGLFNRGIRLYASKKKIHLSENGLYQIFQDGDTAERIRIQTPDEESIFQHLGLPYRPPEQREIFTI